MHKAFKIVLKRFLVPKAFNNVEECLGNSQGAAAQSMLGGLANVTMHVYCMWGSVGCILA